MEPRARTLFSHRWCTCLLLGSVLKPRVCISSLPNQVLITGDHVLEAEWADNELFLAELTKWAKEEGYPRLHEAQEAGCCPPSCPASLGSGLGGRSCHLWAREKLLLHPFPLSACSCSSSALKSETGLHDFERGWKRIGVYFSSFLLYLPTPHLLIFKIFISDSQILTLIYCPSFLRPRQGVGRVYLGRQRGCVVWEGALGSSEHWRQWGEGDPNWENADRTWTAEWGSLTPVWKVWQKCPACWDTPGKCFNLSDHHFSYW